MSENSTNPILLPTIPCHFFEFPESRVDCSSSYPEVCAKCNILGRFLTGGILTDNGIIGPGRTVSIILWMLTLLIGIFGILANSINIIVVTNRKRKKSFDLFLIALAWMDLLGSVTAIMASSSIIAFFGTISNF